MAAFAGLIWLSLSAVATVFGGFVILVNACLWTLVDFLRGINQCNRGGELLLRGEVAQAADVFDEMCRSGRNATWHALPVFNRGTAYMREGRHRRALSLFNAVRHSGRFDRGATTGLAEVMTGYASVLVGELDLAERLLAEGERKLKRENGQALVFPRAALFARRGELGAARAYIAEHHRELVTGEATKRALRLLWAWLAREDVAGDPEEARRLEDGLYPIEPGEFDWVGTEWPEIASYAAAVGRRLS